MAQFSIENGPSKWDLMLALFDRTPARPVKFLIKGKQVNLAVLVTTVSSEDDSDEIWSIAGKTDRGHGEAFTIEATYSTKNRKGEVIIEDDDYLREHGSRIMQALLLSDYEPRLVDLTPDPALHTVECCECHLGFIETPKRCNRCRGTEFRSIVR